MPALDSGDGGASHEIVKQTLTVSGVASTGEIKTESELLEYGTALVNDTHRRTPTLINWSAVDLYYALTFQLHDRSGSADGPTGEELITCEQMEGLEPARNTIDVRLVLLPPRREAYGFSVFCTLRPGASSGVGRASVVEPGGPSAARRLHAVALPGLVAAATSRGARLTLRQAARASACPAPSLSAGRPRCTAGNRRVGARGPRCIGCWQPRGPHDRVARAQLRRGWVRVCLRLCQRRVQFR